MAEEKFDMECTYEEGKTEDLVTFTRSGVNGELKVTKDRFELDARLGFLLGAFKDRIEGEIVKNLDTLLAARTSAGSKAPAKKAAAKKRRERRAGQSDLPCLRRTSTWPALTWCPSAWPWPAPRAAA
jgi:putative polyhydroxyalkanoate system protein